jgi:hypothetical protein
MRGTLVALAFVLLPSTAQTAERQKLPAQFVGDWCFVKETVYREAVYRRGSCSDKSNSWLRIRADGYEAHEAGCKLLSAAPVAKRGDYLAKFQCSGEGQTWNVNHWMSVRSQQLFIEESQQEP